MSRIKNSLTYRIYQILFLTEKPALLSETRIGGMFQHLYLPWATQALLLGVVLYYWYEGLIGDYLPALEVVWIAPTLIVLAFITADKRVIKIYKSHLWYLLFLTVSLISALVGMFLGLNAKMLLVGWIIFAQFGLVLFAAQSIKRKILFLKSVILVALPLAVIGIYQYIANVPTSKLWVSPGENITRVFAFFGSPNIFGAIMCFMLLISLVLYLHERKKLWLVATLVMGVALIFTYSRSAWLALAIGIVYLIGLYKFRFLLCIPLGILILLIPQIRNRLTIVFSDEYISDSMLDGRLWALQNSLYLFKKDYLVGTGPGSYGGNTAVTNASPIYLEGMQNGYTALYYTDNQFLEVLVQTGLVGAITFAGFLIAFLSEVTKKAVKKDIIGLAAGGVMVAFIITGFFGNTFEFGAVSIPAALMIGASLGE